MRLFITKKVFGFTPLLLIMLTVSVYAQGNITGEVFNSDFTSPESGNLLFFGFIGDQDREIRTIECIGAGYDMDYWYDDFQNYQSEAPGMPYDYYFYDTLTHQTFHLAKTIPNNSFQIEEILLHFATWPSNDINLTALPLMDSGVMLSWDVLPSETVHLYRRDGFSQGSFFRVDDTTGSLANPGVSTGQFFDGTVTAGSSYSYFAIVEKPTGKYSPPTAIVTVNASCLTPGQPDADNDQVADDCDFCPLDSENDIDRDGYCADVDNCPWRYNPDQADLNNDGIGDLCCCVGESIGNLDGDPAPPIDMGDLAFMIDMLFISLEPIGCLVEADMDFSGSPSPELFDIDMGDLAILIDHLFISLDPLPPCP